MAAKRHQSFSGSTSASEEAMDKPTTEILIDCALADARFAGACESHARRCYSEARAAVRRDLETARMWRAEARRARDDAARAVQGARRALAGAVQVAAMRGARGLVAA